MRRFSLVAGLAGTGGKPRRVLHPRFPADLAMARVDPDLVFLLGETRRFVLRGRIYHALAPLLAQGGRTREEIVAEQGVLTAAEAWHGLGLLERKGYLVESTPEVPEEQAAFWHSLGLDPVQAQRGVARGALVHGLGCDLAAGDALDIVAADDYLDPALEARNHEALATGRPWMLVRPVGREVWIGPLFVPGQTGCWECLAQRLRANREVEAFVQGRQGPPVNRARAALPSTRALAADLAATQAMRWLAGDPDAPVVGRILTFDQVSLQTERHDLQRRPQCPACGDPGLLQASPGRPAFSSAPAAWTEDGGYRTASPEETLERLARHVSPLTGVVTSVEAAAEPGTPVHVYVAGHNFARRFDDLYFLRRGLRSRSAGKGRSDAQARASCLGEAVERYCGVFRGDEPRRRARLADLGLSALDPRDLLLFSERQYATRAEWNGKEEGGFNYVPEPFDPERAIDWTPAWSLTGDRLRYLPTAFCWYGCRDTFCHGDSNGNAAGNTLEEAALQGLLELVERDAVALWWYSRAHRPGVDLASFGDPYLLRLQEHYRSRGRELWALDVTTDLGIPAFAAVSRRVGGGPETLLMGFGCHLDARVAVLRAVTEVNQFLPMTDATDEEPYGWTLETLATQPHLAPWGAPRALADYARPEGSDVLEALETVRRRVEGAGLEVLLLDQTRPDVGLPVVKMVVPGLRHFWARFAPGRLYDVPVALGWIPRPLAEEELNPVAMFL